MRIRQDSQGVLDFYPATLAVTVEHFGKYEAIDKLLRTDPKILDLVHRELAESLEKKNKKRDRRSTYTSANVLRILICKIIEGEDYRGITVRIDDSHFFRRFTQIYDKDMMSFTTLNWLANQISPETWKKVNERLATYAVENELIKGEKLRLDTTAVETNIHYPSDSAQLWDVYRVLARLIEKARRLDPIVVGNRRLQTKTAKKYHTKISRLSGRKKKKLKKPYKALFRLVGAILAWAREVAGRIDHKKAKYNVEQFAAGCSLVSDIRNFVELGTRVLDVAQRRILNGEKVPNDEKLFSIFEPHTELLKRGKAGKPIEYGHMVSFQQVQSKFITDYEVFDKRPVDYELIDAAIKSHDKLFGAPPKVLAADKGYYQSMEKISELEETIEVVAIGKKGKRSYEEEQRETSRAFKLGQKFRAGIEGTVSFLKRCLLLARCVNKGLTHYRATVGMTVFAHNLLVLALASS